MVPLILIAVAAALPLVFVAATYNRLVALKNHIRDAWANIDTELKRRYDLIPRLVATVKGYAAHERSVMEEVTRLRAQCIANTGAVAAQAADEERLVGAVRRLLAVVESYPDLKADRHFLELQRELVNTEDRIQAARRFYNGNVRDYRNSCETFPSNLVATVFGFKPQDYFSVEPVVREAPRI
jgi:LemA protein